MSNACHRKTRRRYENPQDLRFLTFSCFRRLPLLHNDAVKQVFVERLDCSRQRLGFALLGWVIMPEHVHLLLWPDIRQAPVSRILSDIKGSTANHVLRRWRQLHAPILSRLVDQRGKHRFWQAGGGYDRNLYRREEAIEKLNYMHNNPVRRGLTQNPTDWPWSSASWYVGKREEALLTVDRPLL